MQVTSRLAGPLAAITLLVAAGCSEDPGGTAFPDYSPPALDEIVAEGVATPQASPTPIAAADRPAIKVMLYEAAVRHGVHPALVMGLAWWESGWNPTAVSSAGAIGIMQVMPATAAADGPALLNRTVNLLDPGDNIDMGTAILRNNLDRYHNDLAKALVAYYAGGSAVTDWGHLRPDEQRYVWGVYHLAVAFKDGRGPA
jgi:soluble lytic murein transglycosylase-like protein